MSVRVPLTQGEFAIVDDCDAAEILSHKWFVTIKRTGAMYASRRDGGKCVYMHRQIMGVTDPSVDVDHVNRNGIDNRRKNLRECSHSQNMANKKKQPGKSSKFKGVNQRKGEKTWTMTFGHWADLRRIGGYETEEAAARSYDEIARIEYGRFARLNFPNAGERGINQ